MRLTILVPACFLSTLAGGFANDGESPWGKAASFLVQDAYREFKASGKQIDPMERDFGMAITLLNLQPRTSRNLEKSRELLTGLVETLPETDPLHSLAKFFRARVAAFYETGGSLDSAKQDYTEVVLSESGNPVLESAAARLVYLEGYSKKPPAERLAALGELERLADHLKTPPGIREFHNAMAFAILDNNGEKSEALGHFLAADRAGYTRKTNMIVAWVVAARLATELGKPEVAKNFYTRFLEEYPHDPRAHSVRQLLNQLEIPQ